MKHLTFFIICALPVFVYGQKNEDFQINSKNELNIVIDDIFAKEVVYPIYEYINGAYYVYNPSSNVTTPRIGLGYKFHFSNSALRSKISLGSKNTTNENKIDTNKTENSIFSYSISLGYEFHKNFNRTQLFYGADVYLNNNKSTYKNTSTYNSETYTSETNTSSRALGISPLIGVRYFLSPAISLSTEVKFSIENLTGENNSSYSQNDSKNKNEFSGFQTYFGPIGQLSINIHF